MIFGSAVPGQSELQETLPQEKEVWRWGTLEAEVGGSQSVRPAWFT